MSLNCITLSSTSADNSGERTREARKTRLDKETVNPTVVVTMPR